MPITVDVLGKRVNGGRVNDDDRPALADTLEVAVDLLTEYLRVNLRPGTQVPAGTLNRATLEVANHLWWQRNPGGIINSAFGSSGDAFPIRVSRDALDAARPLVDPWCVWQGFA